MSNTEDKSDDKKVIEAEEMEQLKNIENKEETEEKKVKPEAKEGMEVKPKKIPIGGIQMPGFFTRSKSKEKCKEDVEVENAEAEPKEKKSEPSGLQKIKLPNPFRKSKLNDEEGTNKKSVLNAIRTPINSVISKLKKSDSNMENQVGLASMETLDGQNNEDKSNEMTTIPLNDGSPEKQQPPPAINFTRWIQIVETYKIPIGAALIFLITFIIILIALIIPKDTIKVAFLQNGKYVEAVTQCGMVQGMLEDSAYAFRGIPYARPPVKDLRFHYAQPMNNIDYCWKETFKAHNSSSSCVQYYSNQTLGGKEDCLYLDVVTPYLRYDNLLPVVVLIGSDSVMGGSPGKMRPSARFARAKDVVFVRPNFRLGPLGFLALDMLSQEEYPVRSGNYGLSDILVALEWVQLNIVNFGGDPQQVTLFGHRAGATMVTALATICKAHKYFKRVWASSGGSVYPNKTLDESQLAFNPFLTSLNCSNTDCLRKRDVASLFGSFNRAWTSKAFDLPSSIEDSSKVPEWLVLDGKILVQNPLILLGNQSVNISLILGATAHSALSDHLLSLHKEWNDETIKKHVNNSIISRQNLTDKALKMYSSTFGGLVNLISDIRTVCPLYNLSLLTKRIPLYVVTQTRGPLDVADVDSDVDAILGRYEPKTPEQRRYVSAMQNLFYHYVWDGKIEPKIDLKTNKVLIVGQDVLPNSTYSNCEVWIEQNIVPTYASLF